MYGDLVSVIMPAYNCADFIGESIESIRNQTYTNWELLIVDDCSTDATVAIVHRYTEMDKRIKLYGLEKNSGAAAARNHAVDKAAGIYLAFNDSDDIWKPEKLEKQIQFMSEHSYAFTCTDYGKIDEDGKIQSTVVRCEKTYDYGVVLKKCPGNSTVIYDCHTLGKFHAADIKRRNDFVMWLAVIKKAGTAYGLQETLGYHRVRSGSISYKKTALLKYQWKVYREIEKLGLMKSFYLIFYKICDILLLKMRDGFYKEK